MGITTNALLQRPSPRRTSNHRRASSLPVELIAPPPPKPTPAPRRASIGGAVTIHTAERNICQAKEGLMELDYSITDFLDRTSIVVCGLSRLV